MHVNLGRIHGEFLRLLFFFANKKADKYFDALRYQPHKQEFCQLVTVYDEYRNVIHVNGVAELE